MLFGDDCLYLMLCLIFVLYMVLPRESLGM